MTENGQQKKKKNKVSPIYVIVVCILCAVMAFSAYKIISISTEYSEGAAEYNEIADSYVGDYYTVAFPVRDKTPPASTDTSPTDTEDSSASSGEDGVTDTPDSDTQAATEAQTEAPKPENNVIVIPKVNVEKLKQKNSDFVGWLYLDGTILNYPVAQGEDNDYYLDHTFYGKENINGCLFVDYRLDLEADNYNTLFYGHNMKSGEMFALLKKYAKQSYYDKHKYMIYVTEDGSPCIIEIFSAYTISATSDSWKIDFEGEEDYAEWLDTIVENSQIKCEVVPTVADRVVTLTTCTFVYDDARFVVHGIITPLS